MTGIVTTSKLAAMWLALALVAAGACGRNSSANSGRAGAGSATAGATAAVRSGSDKASAGGATAAGGATTTRARPPAAQVADDEAKRAALNAKGMAFVEKVAAAGQANKGSCSKVAAAWTKLIDAHADLLAEMDKLSTTETPAEKRAFDVKYRHRLDAVMTKIMPVIKKCENDAAVQAAVKKLSM